MAVILRKAADQVASNDDTISVDDTLFVSLGVNEFWVVEFIITYESSTVADFKWRLTLPVFASGMFTYYAYSNTPNAVTVRADNLPAIHVLAGNGAGSIRPLRISVGIQVGSQAGNLSFAWAENTAEVSDTKVHKNSALIATRQ